MLASSRQDPFDDPAWAFEPKWDGYRALALVTSDATELRSRTGRDMSGAYPELADLRRAVTLQEVVLDGEVVVLDERGRPDFNALQNGRGPFTYVAFDLLHADGEWLLDLPWRERRARLADAIAPEGAPRLIVSGHVDGDGTGPLPAAAAEQGLEGIVAKRADSTYRPGQRVREWVKVKRRARDGGVIGGFTEGTGSHRGTLGALLVGEEDEEGRLTYLSHVGSGFSHDLARRLWDRLRGMEVAESPFANDVPTRGSRPRWVRPELRAEVSFAERTPDNRLRAPVFGGLVDDPGEGPDVPPGPFGGQAGDRAIEDGGRRITLTNLDKPYWPAEGITKGHLLDHYLRMAPVLVPHIAGRPQILKRYPDGIEGDFFFQHNVGDQAPHWMRTAASPAAAGRRRRPATTRSSTTPSACSGSPTSAASTSTPGRAWPTRPTSRPTCSSTSTRPTACPSRGSSRRPCWCARRSRGSACAATRGPRGRAGCTSWCRSSPGPDWDAVRLFAQVVSEAPGAGPPGARDRPSGSWPSAGPACTSTRARTGAGGASPASTRCARGPARRWRPPALGRGRSRASTPAR